MIEIVSIISGVIFIPLTLLVLWFLYSSYNIFAFLERQKQRDIEYKLTKLKHYSLLLKEGLVSYEEFKKQTK